MKRLFSVVTLSIFFCVLITACSLISRYKNQINNDTYYLNTEPLSKLNAPKGITFPIQNHKFNIPITNHSLSIEKNLDFPPSGEKLINNSSKEE